MVGRRYRKYRKGRWNVLKEFGFAFARWRRAAAALVMLAALSGTWACSPMMIPIKEDNKAHEKYVPPPNISKRPYKMAEEFLVAVKRSEFDKAYTYLGVDAKLGVSPSHFRNSMESYFSMASAKSVYMSRVVLNEQIAGNTALVNVGDSAYPDMPAWIWEFEKTNAGWKIRSMDLPPLFTYKPKKSRRYY